MSTRVEKIKLRKERDNLYKLFIVKRNQIQMLKDRGYDVKSSGEEIFLNKQYSIDKLLDHFKNVYTAKIDEINSKKIYKKKVTSIRQALSRHYTRPDTGDIVYVYFMPPTSGDKVNNEQLKPFIKFLNDHSYKHYIFILGQELGTSAKNDLYGQQSVNVEVFRDDEMSINPTYRALYSEHQLLTDADRKPMLERTGWNVIDFPKMGPSDKIARWKGLKPGDLIRIKRVQPNEGTMNQNPLHYRFIPDPRLFQAMKDDIQDSENDATNDRIFEE